MAVNSYVKGTLTRLSCTFTYQGSPVDPTTVVFKVKDPTNAVTEYDNPQRDGVGQYHVDVLLSSSGTWWYRAEGTGAAEVAAEAQLTVKVSHF